MAPRFQVAALTRVDASAVPMGRAAMPGGPRRDTPLPRARGAPTYHGREHEIGAVRPEREINSEAAGGRALGRQQMSIDRRESPHYGGALAARGGGVRQGPEPRAPLATQQQREYEAAVAQTSERDLDNQSQDDESLEESEEEEETESETRTSEGGEAEDLEGGDFAPAMVDDEVLRGVATFQAEPDNAEAVRILHEVWDPSVSAEQQLERPSGEPDWQHDAGGGGGGQAEAEEAAARKRSEARPGGETEGHGGARVMGTIPDSGLWPVIPDANDFPDLWSMDALVFAERLSQPVQAATHMGETVTVCPNGVVVQ